MGLFDDVLPVGRAYVPRRSQQLSRPVFSRPTGWQPHSELPELSGFVALDSENKDPGLSQGYGSSWPHRGVGFTCGWAVSWDGGDFYLPTRHSEGNIDPDRVKNWLVAQARKPDVTFLYANCQYDLGWLWRDGVEPVNHPIDVQGMAAVLDEFKMSYGLDSLGREFLGEGKNDAEFRAACAAGGLNDPMSNMDLVPGWLAEPYGVRDASLTKRLFHALQPKIEAEDLSEIWGLERECYLVGFDMKRNGVRVNTDKAVINMERLERARDAKLQAIFEATGIRTSATDNVSIARALRVENPNLDLPQTSQGRDSIRKEVMESLHSPVADLINAARHYDKIISTFFKGYILEGSVRGRIHADFNPLRRSDPDDTYSGMKGAGSGRWSSSDPNLTNIPNRDGETGPAVRECFEAEEGEQWGKLDYAAQEPRIGVHVAEKARIQGAREMADLYRRNPMFDMHGEVATAMNIKRGPAKTINLGIWYGAGGAEVCRRLGLPTQWKRRRDGTMYEAAGPEGEALLRQHFARFPFIKGLQEVTKKAAEARGYVWTLGKRKCRFEKVGDEYKRAYKACNSVIQGSAADQMKKAQVIMRREGIVPLVVVHDECDVSIPQGEAGDAMIARLKDIMESAIPLSIPVVADVKIGENWAAVRG